MIIATSPHERVVMILEWTNITRQHLMCKKKNTYEYLLCSRSKQYMLGWLHGEGDYWWYTILSTNHTYLCCLYTFGAPTSKNSYTTSRRGANERMIVSLPTTDCWWVGCRLLASQHHYYTIVVVVVVVVVGSSTRSAT